MLFRNFILVLLYICICVCFIVTVQSSEFVNESAPNIRRNIELTPNRRRRVVLLGPHDRYNFGDLLFEKVLRKLLVTQSDYHNDEILSGGMVSRSMLSHGGPRKVYAMKTIIEMSHAETTSNGKGPYDIIFTGGESRGCDVQCGARMLGKKYSAIALANYRDIGKCAYAIDKNLLLPPAWPVNVSGSIPRPVAISNSVGGKEKTVCSVPVDYQRFRDVEGNLSSPDCAVMIRLLYSELIEQFATQDEVLKIRQKVPDDNYMAVQFNIKCFEPEIWAQALDQVYYITNLTTVLFLAGSAPGHDRVSLFKKVKKLMQTPCLLLESEHVWKVVALISKAKLVVSTSLHVRIMAFIYHKPRVLVVRENDGKNKHAMFVKLWEGAPFNTTIDHPSRLDLNYVTYLMKANMKPTIAAVDNTIAKYLESFFTWSKLLNE